EPEQMKQLIQGCSYVIHAAALAGSWPTRSQRYFDINVAGTRHVMEAALEARAKRVVLISSSSAVGFTSSKIHPGHEETPWRGDMGLDYVKSKYEADQLVESMVREQNLPALMILPGFMIGPYDTGPSSGQLLVKAWNSPFKFCTAGGKNFVYNQDVAVAVVNALEMGRIGERYICGGHNLTFRALFRLIEETIGLPQSNLILPPWVSVGLAHVLSGVGKMIRTKPLLTPEMAHNANQKIFFSSAKAQAELKLPQTDIRQALREAYLWFDQNGYLKSYENTPQALPRHSHNWLQPGHRQDYSSLLS
ncbi:MAG: NAD-dependent epimerase/dehydratase family protein, partial [Bacteroidota bacterium]